MSISLDLSLEEQIINLTNILRHEELPDAPVSERKNLLRTCAEPDESIKKRILAYAGKCCGNCKGK